MSVPRFHTAAIVIPLLVAGMALSIGEVTCAAETVKRPNVLIILADDMGFSDAGCYGGEIATPNLDALANNGLRFTQFYNTARCWPSRAAILTGYYAQQVRRDTVPGVKSGTGGTRPPWARLLPEMLEPLDYRSYHSGKWHLDGKPLDNGFDHSYSLEDHDRHFMPRRHTEDDKSLPPVSAEAGYYSSTAIADHAIKCLKEHAEKYRDRPFFEYLAFTAPHFPLQAPPEDIARYRKTYLAGWDVMRQDRWRRLQELHIGGTSLSAIERDLGPPYAYPNDLKKLGPGEVNRPLPWKELNAEQREFQARKMAVHAAMVDRMDREIGRVLDQVRAMGQWDNTLIVFLSDNGASAEIMVRGDGHDHRAECGSGASFVCIGPGWSSLANTPFRRHKTWVHEGGISTPLIVHWPKGITASGELRHAPCHIIDIVPTVLEAVGGKRPAQWQGTPVPPAPGKSLVSLFAKDGTLAHGSLWWQHEGNRALRVGNWKIVAAGKDSPWELYDLTVDRSETKDLAKPRPEQVRELAAIWSKQFEEYSALAAKDLPEDVKQTALFVSGKDGYHTYRIPSLLVTKKGTLLAFCEGRKTSSSDSGDIDLLLKRSFDGGKTWARMEVVWDDGGNTCGNPCPVLDARTGTIWLLLTHNLGSDTQAMIVNGTSKGTRTVWVMKSDDDGATWSKPIEITKDVKKPDWTWYATGPGVGTQLKSGRLVVPCDNQVAGSKVQQSHVIVSDDGGKTWKLGGVVGPQCNESQVVELHDGSLMLNVRSYRGNNRRLVAISKDGGETFSKPVENKELIEPVCQASIVRHPGEHGGILFSNPASTKRERMIVRLSRDEGKTWPHSKVLHDGPSAYSCLAVLPDGTIACLYERGDKSAYETITLARLPLHSLTENKQGTRNRRILYNLDGDSCLFLKKGSHAPGLITADDLKTIVHEITRAGSQVDTLLVCVNAQVMYYPTKVGTLRGRDCTPEERKNWPASERQRFRNVQAMFDAGTDPYAVLLAEARRRGLEALLTFRMNDAHGNDFLRTAFWREHPEYRLGKGALDFKHDAVREFVFRLIEEAVQRYDCDGIELDFQRFPTFFQDATTAERVTKINGLVERVRRMIDVEGKRRGKRLVLGARAPSDYGRSAPNYERARMIGCDPVAWAKNGWVDFLTVSEFLFVRYDLPVKPWKQLIRDVPIYGGIECTEGGKLEQCLTADKYRRAARHLWADGADGVYLFNFFTPREREKDAFEPPFEVLQDIGDPGTIPAPARLDAKAEQGELVFSVKTWEGDYSSKDVPGGVETTPVIGAIYSVKADGTDLRKVVGLGKSTDYPSVSPDGRWVYFQSNATGSSRVYRCRPDGTGVISLTTGDKLGKKWKDAFGYSLSTDGTKLLYTVHDGSTGHVALANADGSGPRLIAPELGYIYMGALSPGNDRVVFSGPAHGYRLLLAALPDGKAVELTPEHPECFVPQFTPDGATIVFLRRDGDVYRVDTDGRNLRRLTAGNRHVEFKLSQKDQHGSTDGPHVSPDGKRIAYVAAKEGVANVWTMNLDGTEQRQLTFRTRPCGRVRWSPDGAQVAFVSFEGKYPQLFVVAAKGGEPRQLTRLEGAVYFVNWRPDRTAP